VFTTVVSHMRILPLYQGFKVKPSGLLPSFVKPTDSKVEERLTQVNDFLRMELMAGWLGNQPVFLMQERPWSPSQSASINLPHQHSVLSKILAPVLEGNCNTELIRVQQVSHTSNWEGF